jgi:diguanylate cyclase (GGDEF)-like protein
MDFDPQFSGATPRAYGSDELEQHLRALAQTAVSLARDIDAETMLSCALRACASSCHASRAVILTRDSRDGSLHGIVPALGVADEDALGLHVSPDECETTKAALESGVTAFGESAGNVDSTPKVVRRFRARDWMAAPVTSGRDIAGVLYLMDKDAGFGTFNALDVAFVRTAIGLLGGALQGLRVRDRIPSSVVGNVAGLVGQDGFEEVVGLEVERAERLGHPLGCAVIEVVDFANILEAHGPQAADVVMRHLGQTLAKHVRQIDVLARYDDRRIVALMPGTPGDVARVVVRRLDAQVSRISWPKIGKISLRFGVASYPEETKTAHELVATTLKAAATANQENSGAA